MGVISFTDATLTRKDGASWLNLKLHPNALYRAMRFLDEKKGILYDADLKRHREPRSLNANAYCWVLCDEIGKVVRLSSEDVYRKAILDVGVFVPLHVEDTRVDEMVYAWERNGLGWMALDMGSVKGYTTLHAYKGSSCYTKEEMARLLDWLIQEATDCGIDTRTPDEIAKMKALWDEN